jgi:outer membrane protein
MPNARPDHTSVSPVRGIMNRAFHLLALALLAVPAAAAAQPDVPQVLRLEDAQRIARANNPDYLKFLNDEDVAAAGVRAAWGAFLPTVNTSMGWNLSSSTRVTGENDFGEPIRLDDPITYRSSGANQGISTGVTLFDGGQNLRNLTVARAEVTNAETRVATQASLLATNVTGAFYNTVQALRRVEIEERALANAEARLAQTISQFEIATTSQVDVLGARQNVINARQSLAQQRAAARTQRLMLTATLGVDAGTAFELDMAVPEVFDPATLDADALVARAATAHPAVRQAEANLASARASASAARGTRWPTVGASFSFSRNANRPGTDAFGDFNPLNRGWGAGLSINLPVFQGFGTSHQIERADAVEQDASYDRRRIAILVEQDIRSALVELERAYEQLGFATELASLTEERLGMAEEQYRIGALDFLQLQQLIDQNLAAQRDAVDAQFTFITARATLEEKLGAPIAD